MVTGARKVWTGRALPTATATALESAARALGADERVATRMAEAADTALSAVAPLGAARAAGYGVRFMRYPSVGGYGINLENNGRRFFSADVHRIPYKGVKAVGPHYHRRPGIDKHRPWEGW